MKTISIEGEKREVLGKKVNKAMRKHSMVPCVLYGGEENIHFITSQNAIKNLVFTPDFMKVELNINGTQKSAILKDMQFHPLTDKVTHLDFLELVPGKSFVTDLPVRLVGTAEGVKAGGKLLLKKRTLKVKATPENLIDHIELDVSELMLGKSIKVSAVDAPGIELLDGPGIPIAGVEIPRALKSAASKAAGEDSQGEEGAEEAAE